MKLSRSLKSALYWFVEAYSKGQVGDKRWELTNDAFDEGILSWEEYQRAIADTFVMKLAITVWSNNIEVDERGRVLNEDWARFRAFQAIRNSFNKNFSQSQIKPPLEPQEVIENESDKD